MNDIALGQEISLRAKDQDLVHKNTSDYVPVKPFSDSATQTSFYFQGLSETSLHVILSTEEKTFGNIKTISQAACRLLGQTQSEIEGKHFSALSFNAIKSYYTSMISKLLQGDQLENIKDGLQLVS